MTGKGARNYTLAYTKQTDKCTQEETLAVAFITVYFQKLLKYASYFTERSDSGSFN